MQVRHHLRNLSKYIIYIVILFLPKITPSIIKLCSVRCALFEPEGLSDVAALRSTLPYSTKSSQSKTYTGLKENGTVQKNTNKFGFSFDLHYLCSPK